ncbi:MAG: DPP IV N-terminal domain-containing protein, partial [Bryobacterales bacterium]|nr:DPP IV N-terminal domain-containing protein [Bryobacterales bacterium]
MRRLLTGCLLLSGLLWAQKKPVSLEAVTAAPVRGAGSPVWSPDGKRFLTVKGTQLSLYDVAAKAQRDLLDLRKLDDSASPPPVTGPFVWENRGVAEQPVQWSSDGAQVLLSRAGEVFLLDVASGAHRQLTKTREWERDPKLAPNGKSLAFRVGHDLHAMDVASGKTKPLTKGGTSDVRNAELDWVYPEELGLPTAYWWSPDSRRIAYLQFDQTNVPIYPHGDLTQVRPVAEPQRYAQAGTENAKVRLGLVAASGGATKWIDLPEIDGRLIARVDWLPDSSALAVALINRVQNELRWVRVDGRSGAVTLYEQKDPAWVNLGDYRFLQQSKRLLLTAERPDFRHLYWLDLAQPGSAPQPVTRGDWEVTALNCVDEAGGWIYYTASETSPLERHLYRVKFDGSGKSQITQGRG